MSDDMLVSRRPVLLTGLATAATTVFAGCSSSTDTSGASADPSESASSAGGSGGPSEAIVDVSAVPVGGAVAAKDGSGKPIIVSQPQDGDIVAFTAICTHKGCTVAPSGAQLKCPCHGSVYDAFTGKNVSGPAPAPLAAVPVTVAGGKVMPG
jgi:Rieske Fe-S protein